MSAARSRPAPAAARARALAAALAAFAALSAAPARAGVRPTYGGTIRLALPVLPREADPALAAEPADLLLARATAGLLLEVDGAGRLAPGLLAEVPRSEAGGLAWRLRVDPAARTAAGAPVRAADVARTLARLAASPHAWAALPLARVEPLSDLELLVTLALPLPELPWLLATTACAVPGAGPFVAGPPAPGRPLLLAANPHAVRGRPLADALLLSAADARGAARLLERGGLDGVLRPEAAGPGARPLPALTVTVAAVNGARLGPAAAGVRAALAALDRAALARRFARGPAVPLDGLVPPALLGDDAPATPAPAAPAAPAAARRAPEGARPVRLTVPEGAPDARAAAERLQVLLFDRDLRASVEVLPRATFAARAAAGELDVTITSVTVLGLRPALAAAQLAFVLRGPDAARRALAALAGKEGSAARDAAAALARSLDLHPLLASGERASAAPRLQGLAPGAGAGAPDPAGLWLVGGGTP